MQFSSSLVLAALPMLTFAAPPFPNTTYLFSGAISLAKIPPPVPLVTGSTLNSKFASDQQMHQRFSSFAFRLSYHSHRTVLD